MGSVHAYMTRQGKRYRVAYRKPDRKEGTKRGFKTKKEAELYLATVEISKSRGEYIDPSAGRISLDEYGREWLDGQAHLKPSAFRSIESAWRIWVQPKWGQYSISDIHHGEVKAWIGTISRERSATTVARAYGVLAGILDAAVLDLRLHANRARGVKLPKKRRVRRIYLSHKRVEQLAAQMGRRRTLIYFLAYVGPRWGEATAVRVRDLDLERLRANIIDNAVDVGGELVTGSPKTHRVRTVPFPAFLADLLTAEVEGKSPDDLVFGDGEHHERLPHSRNGWFEAAIRRVQALDPSFPRLTPHDLRHTAASLAISAGANVKAVQRMLGHASAAMTLDIYADLFDDDLDSVALKLDEARALSLAA